MNRFGKASVVLALVACVFACGNDTGASETAAQKGIAAGAVEIAQNADKPADKAAEETQEKNPLLDPKDPAVNQTAPDVFKVKLVTSKGDVLLEVHRDWAPKGADRFYNLVNAGFYDECRFFRVIDNFMVQFGLNGDPSVSAAWKNAKLEDDSVNESNKRGYVSYAMAGKNTRTTQLFINYKDNSRLDGMGFSPFAKVIEGMDTVDMLYSSYGENPPEVQGSIQSIGNSYLQEKYPKLDYIKSATVVK